MICPRCSKMISDCASFCLHCGARVAPSPPKPETAPPPPSPDELTIQPELEPSPALNQSDAALSGAGGIGSAEQGKDEKIKAAEAMSAAQATDMFTTKEKQEDKSHPLEGDLLLGRYEIKKPLKRGGMGAIYEVFDIRLKKRWALKEMIEFFIGEDDKVKAKDRFEREATLLASLTHPNLPRVIDFFEEGERFYLIMDYVVGEDLTETLKKCGSRQLPENTVIKVARDILGILDYLHNIDPPIVYRDVKPSNIMIRSSDNSVVLVDFGIARTLSADQTTKTEIGTIGYAPPEQYAGNPLPVSDIYALGATMHELLSGVPPRIPFQFQPVRTFNSSVTQNLERVIMKALELDPGNRWKSAYEMREVLQQISTQGAPLLEISTTTVTAPPIIPTPRVQSGTSDLPGLDTSTLISHRLPEKSKTADIPGLDTTTLGQGTPGGEISSSRDNQTTSVDLARAILSETEMHQMDQMHREETARLPGAPSLEPPWKESKSDEKEAAPHVPPLHERVPSKSTSMLTADRENSLVKLLKYQKKFKEQRSYRIHNDHVNTFAFHPQKEIIASASKDGTIRMWDIQANKEILSISEQNLNITQIAFSPDGRNLVYNSAYNKISIVDTRTKLKVTEFDKISSMLTAIALNTIDVTIAIGSNDGDLVIYNYASQSYVKPKFYQKPITTLAFSPDGKFLASGHHDGSIMLWEVASKKPLKSMKMHEGRVTCLGFAPHSRMLATGSTDGSIAIWTVPQLNHVRSMKSDTGGLLSLDFARDNPYLGTSSEDSSIRFWDLQDGELNIYLEKNLGTITKIAFGIYQTHVGLVNQIPPPITPGLTQNWYFVASGESGIVYYWKIQ